MKISNEHSESTHKPKSTVEASMHRYKKLGYPSVVMIGPGIDNHTRRRVRRAVIWTVFLRGDHFIVQTEERERG